jgi:hypothetical protein
MDEDDCQAILRQQLAAAQARIAALEDHRKAALAELTTIMCHCELRTYEELNIVCEMLFDLE